MPKILTNGHNYSIKLKIILISALVFVMVGLMTSSAFAEETEEKFKITFDEGDYKLEYNDIIVPIKLQVLDHDYKITPEYFVRSQGKTIEHYVWSNINSGDFTSYLLLNNNWSSGTYQIVLKYDEKYFKPLTFTLTKQSDSYDDNQQTRAEVGIEKEEVEVETYLKVTTEKIIIPDKPLSWFSYNQLPLPLEGQIDTDGATAILYLVIIDPDNKETLYKMHVLDDGTFQSGIMLDSSWKSGKYKVSGKLYGIELATTEFVIDNPRIKPNPVDVKQETTYETSILLSSQSAGEFEVLNVSGTSDSPSENLARENPIFKEAVKLTLTPLLTSLTLLNYVDIDTEQEMLGYGIGIIMLNIGMYFVAPAVLVITMVKRFN